MFVTADSKKSLSTNMRWSLMAEYDAHAKFHESSSVSKIQTRIQ